MCFTLLPVCLLSNLGSQSGYQTAFRGNGTYLYDFFSHSILKGLDFDSQIAELFRTEGLSLEQIAGRLGISRDRVSKGLRRAGIGKVPHRRPLDLTGQTPFGWKREKGKLVPHAREQKAIAQMIEARRSGLSLHATARALAADGVRTKSGGKWHAKTISQILECNARLLGEHERRTREQAQSQPNQECS